jgi:hypothetical protein
MFKTAPSIMAVICPLVLFGQAKNPPAKSTLLPKLNDVMTMERLKFGIRFIHADLPLRRANQVVDDMVTWILKNGRAAKDSTNPIAPQYTLIAKYYTPLGEAFNGFRFVGDQTSTGRFLYDPGALPIVFADRNGQVALLISGLVSESVFNTLKTSANQRAALVAKKMVIPSVKDFKGLEGTDIQFYAISVLYSSKDFVKDDDARPEYLMFVAPAKACHAFIRLELSDQDLLDASDIFVSDREMGTDFRKTKLQIE